MARAGLINADLRSTFPGQLYAALGWWVILRGVAGAAMVDKLTSARVQVYFRAVIGLPHASPAAKLG